MKNGEKSVTAVDGLYRSVRKVIEEGRKVVSIAANAVLVRQNWSIGKLIVEDEQKGRRKAEYGKKTLEALSARLTSEYGRGYDASNLRYMRQFYLAFPICDALRHELGWTHYRILMREDDPIAREWYMNECVAGGWSSRDLDRQVSTDAYHRLLAAANPDRRRKQKELPLTKLPAKPKSLVPADFIKNPMMLEFLSLPEDVKIRETKLESSIISHLKDVLMELGRGFSFVARQKHMRSGSDDYFIDLVFYNYILKCFFLIDLKMGKVTHKDVGQMDMYRRMFDDQVCGKDDNPTVGIVLCDEIEACAQDRNKKACNIFTPNESRKTAQLCLDFIAAIAGASSMAAVAASRPTLEVLAAHAQRANNAVASALPKNCLTLITCVASGEQFFLNLLLRGDSTALALAKIAHHMALPLRQIFLLCSQKLHEQLTVGC